MVQSKFRFLFLAAAIVTTAADDAVKVLPGDLLSKHVELTVLKSLLDLTNKPKSVNKGVVKNTKAHHEGKDPVVHQMARKHVYGDKKSKKSSSAQQLHLLRDDTTTTTATGDATDTTPSTPSATSPSSAPSGTWQTGDWGPCHANCGTGPSFRNVTCVTSDGGALDVSYCDASTQPTTVQTCQGDCVSCSASARFLGGMGVSSVPDLPLVTKQDQSANLCAVQNTTFTCCPSDVETEIQVVYSQLRRNMKTQTNHREISKQRLTDLYANVTNVITDRVAATTAASDAINTAMDNAAVITPSSSSSAAQLQSLRTTLAQALDNRSYALQTALSDLALAQDEISQQLLLMDSSEADLDSDSSNISFNDTNVTFASSGGNGDMFGSLYNSLLSPGGASSPQAQAIETQYFSDSTVGVNFESLVERAKRIHFDHVADTVDHATNKTRVPGSLAQTDPLAVTNTSTSTSSNTAANTASNTTNYVNYTDPNVRIVSGACETAIDNYFTGLACATCNPRFPITNLEAPASPYVKLSSSSCSALFASCSDSLVDAHNHMVGGIGALLNSHGNLISVAAQVQPILDRVWSELNFDWLPGFSPFQLAKPDLTNMACIQDLSVFTPFTISNSTDFCNGYFSYANPRVFIQRLTVQLDRGVFAMAKFASCDRCVHSTMMFLADVLGSTNKGSLRVSLPTSASEMLTNCGSGASIQLPPPGSNITAYAAFMTPLERASPRVAFPMDASSAAPSAFAQPNSPLFEEWSDAPPPEWKYRTLVDQNNNTIPVPVVDNSISSSVTPNGMVQLHVMNQNCTTHAECDDQDSPSGTGAWWFCAHPNACTVQPGACTSDAQKFFETGPKCARGPCTNDMSSIDKKCPTNAICPTSASASTAGQPYFGTEYFSKFDSIINQSLQNSITDGVCDCAFDSSGNIIDQCTYARCLAYASLVETSLTCTSALSTQCSALQQSSECSSDPTLSCFDKDTILTYPPPNAGECPLTDNALASESRESSLTVSVSGILVIFIAAISVW